MRYAYPNQVVSFSVQVFGSGGVSETATLSAATLTIGAGSPINATINGQDLLATVPSDQSLGLTTFVWAWTQVVLGVTSNQPVSYAVTIIAQPLSSSDSCAPTRIPLPSVNGFPPIYVAFNSLIDSSSMTNLGALAVWRSPLVDFDNRHAVTGTWALSTTELALYGHSIPPGCAAIFTPGELIQENSRYTVSVGPSVMDIHGNFLAQEMEYEFLSHLRPIFIDPYAVRMRLDEYSDKISTEQIYWHGWQASLRTNREVMRFVPTYLMAGPTEQQIVEWNFARTYAMNMFAEIETCILIVRAMLVKAQSEVDRKVQGLDFSTSVEDGLIRNFKETIRIFTMDRDRYYAEISNKRPRIRTASKSAAYPNAGSPHAQQRTFPFRHKF